MTPQEVMRRCGAIMREAGHPTHPNLTLKTILPYTEQVANVIIHTWSKRTIDTTRWLPEFSEGLKRIRDNADVIIRADPMILYTPAHSVAEQYHQSHAWVRYFCGGRRTSKTQCGYSEDYWYATGTHPYRKTPPGQGAVGIISFDFANYQAKVFEAKFLSGEPGNAGLTPMFPETGRWFYNWNPRTRTITIACKQCADTGKAQSCKHPKSTISLFSAEQGKKVMEGFVLSFLHCDEDVPEDMYDASLQRLTTVKNSAVTLTGSPNAGPEAWQQVRYRTPTLGPKSQNLYDPDHPETSVPYASYHTIDQFSAGLGDPRQIKAQMRDYDVFEIEVYVYGRPAVLAKRPVFHRDRLAELRRGVRDPACGSLALKMGTLVDASFQDEVAFYEDVGGHVRVWERPNPAHSYIIGADAAAGLFGGTLTKQGDPSCASVVRVYYDQEGQLQFDLVAQYHGWCNVLDYADQLKLLGLWYYDACIVLELTGGHGRATMLRLKRELFYANIFVDTEKPEETEEGIGQKMGLDTNSTSKPAMVGALQNCIKTQRIRIPCVETVKELTQYEQEQTPAGVIKYRGAQGTHDDRVMSLAMAVYAPLVNPLSITVEDTQAVARNSPMGDALGIAMTNEEWESFQSW